MVSHSEREEISDILHPGTLAPPFENRGQGLPRKVVLAIDWFIEGNVVVNMYWIMIGRYFGLLSLFKFCYIDTNLGAVLCPSKFSWVCKKINRSFFVIFSLFVFAGFRQTGVEKSLLCCRSAHLSTVVVLNRGGNRI